MTAERIEPETYTIDDTIRVPIELADDDGVAHVRAIFPTIPWSSGATGRTGSTPQSRLPSRSPTDTSLATTCASLSRSMTPRATWP